MREFVIFRSGASQREIALAGGLALALGLSFAWLNPFDIYAEAFLLRMTYWCGMFLCWLLILTGIEGLLRHVRLYRRARPKTRQALAVAVSAIVMIPIVVAATHGQAWWTENPAKLLEFYVKIILIGSAIALIVRVALAGDGSAGVLRPRRPLRIGTMSSQARTTGAESQSPPARDNRLILRLPPDVRGPILCLKMEDHYVRVHTDRGSALLLLRLQDAIAELGAVPGRQVHRSWWVADTAVQRYERAGRTGRIHFVGDLVAPVSQRYMQSLTHTYAPAVH